MTEQDFLDSIKADPFDQGLRLVYSDWLMEQGRIAEAGRQRQWIEAYEFLKMHTRAAWWWRDYHDTEDEEIPEAQKYEEVIGEIQQAWLPMVQSGYIAFGSTYPQEALQDSATRQEFWRCFAVITGMEAPEALRNEEFYGCVC